MITRSLEGYQKANLLMEKVKHQLNKIFIVEPMIKEEYHLNLDNIAIWTELFGQLSFMEILNVDDDKLGKMVSQLVNNKREWLTVKMTIIPNGNALLTESIIFKLFEEYGDKFQDESKVQWYERWLDDIKEVKPLNVASKFEVDNNRHLILTILHETHPFIKKKHRIFNVYSDYVEIKWGLKNYEGSISRYINDNRKKNIRQHSERENIHKIIEEKKT